MFVTSLLASEAIGAPHPAVVRVMAADSSGVSYGSGTLIDVSGQHGLVITNWHVVRDAVDKVTVIFPEGFRSDARVVKVDDNWDLAVLVIWRPPADPVPLATRAPKPGDLLTIAGYGSGQYRAKSGHCTQYVAPGRDFPFEMIEVSVEARNGDSGGPIFNDRGELAGVLFGASPGSTSGSFVGRVRWFIASVLPEAGGRDQALASVESSSRPQEYREQPRPRDVARLPSLSDGSAETTPRLATPKGISLAPIFSAPNHTSRNSTTETLEKGPLENPALEHEKESTHTLSWSDLAGETLFQQVKTVLAVIGLFAVLLQFTRFTLDD